MNNTNENILALMPFVCDVNNLVLLSTFLIKCFVDLILCVFFSRFCSCRFLDLVGMDGVLWVAFFWVCCCVCVVFLCDCIV